MEETKEILSKVKHPEINSSLVELGMIGEIKEESNKISVELKLPFKEIPIREILENLIKEALKDKGKVEVFVSLMSDEEKMKFLELARRNWAL